MIVFTPVDENDYVVELALDDVTYFIRMSWNSEAEYWVMGIENSLNELVLQGVVLVSNVPLLTQFTTYDVPPGEFVVYSPDDNYTANRTDFLTKKCALLYLTPDEYAALR